MSESNTIPLSRTEPSRACCVLVTKSLQKISHLRTAGSAVVRTISSIAVEKYRKYDTKEEVNLSQLQRNSLKLGQGPGLSRTTRRQDECFSLS